MREALNGIARFESRQAQKALRARKVQVWYAFHCRLYRALVLFSDLWGESPKNGNSSMVEWRLAAISEDNGSNPVSVETQCF